MNFSKVRARQGGYGCCEDPELWKPKRVDCYGEKQIDLKYWFKNQERLNQMGRVKVGEICKTALRALAYHKDWA